jgi:hypothetical protein
LDIPKSLPKDVQAQLRALPLEGKEEPFDQTEEQLKVEEKQLEKAIKEEQSVSMARVLPEHLEGRLKRSVFSKLFGSVNLSLSIADAFHLEPKLPKAFEDPATRNAFKTLLWKWYDLSCKREAQLDFINEQVLQGDELMTYACAVADLKLPECNLRGKLNF